MAGFRHRPVSIRSERARPLPCKATPDLRPPRFDDDWRQRRRKRVPFLSSCENANRGALSPHGGRRKGPPCAGPRNPPAASRRQAGSVPFLLRKCEPEASPRMAAAGRGLPAHGPASSAASRRQADSVPFLLQKREPGAPPRMAAAGRGLPAQGPASSAASRRQAGSVPFLLRKCEPEASPRMAAAGRGLPAHGPASSAASRRQADSVPFLLRKREPEASPRMAAAGRGSSPRRAPQSSRRFAPASGFRSFPPAKMRTGGRCPRMAAAGRGLPAQGPAILPPLRAGKRVPFLSSCENANRKRRPAWRPPEGALPPAGPRILRRFAPASGFRSFPLAKMRTGGVVPALFAILPGSRRAASKRALVRSPLETAAPRSAGLRPVCLSRKTPPLRAFFRGCIRADLFKTHRMRPFSQHAI